MTRTQKSLFVSLTLLLPFLLTTGCAPKNPDGTYASAYSYHPYLKYNHSKRPNHPHHASPKRLLRHPLPANHIVKRIEKTAKSLLGADYQYGAEGPNHYDCSGFTQYVFSKEGIRLPRVSREQAKIGEFVTANQLQKGDLIFFDSKKSPRISHVGIYLGEGNFIHASSVQDKVTISNLRSHYYAKHFKWGRRLTHLNYARR